MSSFVSEMWTWFAVTVVVVAARLLSRRLLYQSFKGLQLDDWLMLFVLIIYTILLAIVWVQTYTPTNLVRPGDEVGMSEEEIKRREYGSKLVLVTEHLTVFTLWGVKACLLLMYSRLTMSLRQNLLVKIVAYYVAASFVVMEVLWFVWCRPFHFYWKVPPPDLNCSAETNHMITQAVFNISSDIMIICLPMPVLIQSQLPQRRKLVLCTVFALGVFTIIAASLSKYYSLGSPYGTEWIFWYIREVSTAIITANLPLTWTLLQRIFGLSAFYNSRYGKSSNPRTGDATSGAGGRFRSAYGNLTSRTRDERTPRKPVHPNDIEISPSSSQEQINISNEGFGMPLKIWQQREVHVTTEEILPGAHTRSGSREGMPVGIELGPVAVTNSPPGSIHEDKPGDGEMGVVTKVSHGV